jgi:uncharacterized protein (DUF2147 family)
LHKIGLLLFISLGAADGLQVWFRDCGVDGGAGRSAGERAGRRTGRYLADAGRRRKGARQQMQRRDLPQVDDKNSNPALARRPIIGLSLFIGMRPAGADKWSGQIYNADDGKTYASSVSVAGPDTLKVEGCVGAFCGGETWTRAAR